MSLPFLPRSLVTTTFGFELEIDVEDDDDDDEEDEVDEAPIEEDGEEIRRRSCRQEGAEEAEGGRGAKQK